MFRKNSAEAVLGIWYQYASRDLYEKFDADDFLTILAKF